MNRKDLESLIAETVKEQLEQAGSNKKFLTPEELSERWGVTMRCLEKWRLQGKPPVYMKIQGSEKGSIRYPLYVKDGVLDAEAKWLRSSTTDVGNDDVSRFK